MRKQNFSAQGSFYLQDMLSDINAQDTSFLDCKYKHMMKCGASPDKFGVLYCLLPIEFHGFTSRINSKGSLFGSWFYLNFLTDVMGPFKPTESQIT